MSAMQTRIGRTNWKQWVCGFSLLAACASGVANHSLVAAELGSKDFSAKDLYRGTNVWTAHFKFTAEQWEAMEPEGGPGGFGGPGGGNRGPGGPGGGRPPGGGMMFGPSMFIAPSFLKGGDADSDGKISSSEFSAMGEKWFGVWDKDKTGSVNADQLRTGLNATMAPPEFGPPGGGPGRGPGGGGGMMLQGAEGKRNGLASSMGIEFDYVHADLDFNGVNFTNVAVRYKGNGTFLQSRDSIKRSMKVDLNEFVKGQKLGAVSKLNFHNAVTDASWMNEVLSHRLYRDAGVPAARTAYVKVYVTVTGKYDKQYLGLYSLVENVDNNFAEDNFQSKKGAIFKPVTPNLFADLGDSWKQYNQTYDPKSDLSVEDSQRVIDFAKFVTKSDDAEFAAKLGDYLDLEKFARYMAVTVWLSTMDSILGPGQNYYIYLNAKTRKFEFLPWDLDHSFGQFHLNGTQEGRENLNINQPWTGPNRFLERVYKVEAFKQLYHAQLTELSKTVLQPARFAQQVDELGAILRPAVEAESKEKLERFDKAVAGEGVSPAGFGGGNRGGGPGGPGGGPGFGGPGGPGGFGAPVKPIKGFVKARAVSVNDQLAGKSTGQQVGGFGMPPGGGPGGPGGAGGPPRDFGPGTFLGGTFMTLLDADKNSTLTREEVTQGFAKLFAEWNADKSGVLTEAQLRAGIDKSFAPPPGFGGPGGPGPGGPPPGR